MKKRMIYYFFIISLILIFLPFVNANFVCGEIQYDQSVSPSWLNVKINYLEKPLNFTSCKVSPQNLRYCCDPLEIKSVSWQIGKVVNSRVFDVENGYFSNSSSLVISGEGYDVFPTLNVEKGINIISPNKKVYLNNQSFLLNFSSASIFNDLFYEINSQNYTNIYNSCFDCNNFQSYLEDLDSNHYNFSVKASGDVVNYSSSIVFSLIDYININRNFECKGCSNQRVKSGGEINVTLFVNLSHYSEGKILEYIPIDWTVTSENLVEPFSETHNLISFDISGKEVMLNYTILPPNNIFSSKYSFISSFEDIYSIQNNVTLSKYKLFDFFGSNEKIVYESQFNYDVNNFIIASEREPLIYYPDSELVSEIIFFVNDKNKEIEIKYSEGKYPSNLNLKKDLFKKIFYINSNLQKKSIENISFKFKLNNSEFNNFKLYYLNKSRLLEINYSKYNSDENFSYYSFTNSREGFYLILNQNG